MKNTNNANYYRLHVYVQIVYVYYCIRVVRVHVYPCSRFKLEVMNYKEVTCTHIANSMYIKLY